MQSILHPVRLSRLPSALGTSGQVGPKQSACFSQRQAPTQAGEGNLLNPYPTGVRFRALQPSRSINDSRVFVEVTNPGGGKKKLGISCLDVSMQRFFHVPNHHPVYKTLFWQKKTPVHRAQNQQLAVFLPHRAQLYPEVPHTPLPHHQQLVYIKTLVETAANNTDYAPFLQRLHAIESENYESIHGVKLPQVEEQWHDTPATHIPVWPEFALGTLTGPHPQGMLYNLDKHYGLGVFVFEPEEPTGSAIHYVPPGKSWNVLQNMYPTLQELWVFPVPNILDCEAQKEAVIHTQGLLQTRMKLDLSSLDWRQPLDDESRYPGGGLKATVLPEGTSLSGASA